MISDRLIPLAPLSFREGTPDAPCREYLPTFPLECGHSSPYIMWVNNPYMSIHGSYGYIIFKKRPASFVFPPKKPAWFDPRRSSSSPWLSCDDDGRRGGETPSSRGGFFYWLLKSWEPKGPTPPMPPPPGNKALLRDY